MSKKIAGVNVLLKAAVDGDKAIIGGQTGSTLNRSSNIIEVTSKDGNGWAESLAGVKSWSVDCDGFLVLNDAGLEALEQAWEDGEEVEVELEYNGKVYSGQALISDFPNEFPQDDAVTFSLSLTGTGALAKNPSS
ncbi:phage major tail protein, TP901-1 family [Priestia megaterium]|uniref:phage major tail protein, TP901-1 family n=1 Tax=Priestia megaterium TaxID=1404 RepID=UPI000BF2DE98|nr:phage major tail protein, TP901-1 family [Priestia megaterium]PFW43798.1 phage major tail protein, TP901-1 family [Priestia megaterium]